jgi:two-component system phosphoglycerate transport system response regulator PgtA
MTVFRTPKILMLSSNNREASDLQALLSAHAEITQIRDTASLCALLENSSFDVALCSWAIDDDLWDLVLSKISSVQPELPVIVFSSNGGVREWAQVLEAGAFDLLVSPFQQSVLLSALEQATASHEARLMRLAAVS